MRVAVALEFTPLSWVATVFETMPKEGMPREYAYSQVRASYFSVCCVCFV